MVPRLGEPKNDALTMIFVFLDSGGGNALKILNIKKSVLIQSFAKHIGSDGLCSGNAIRTFHERNKAGVTGTPAPALNLNGPIDDLRNVASM